MNIYESLGLKRVVNASGRMTPLGVSTISDEVADAAVAAAQNYVSIADLIDKAGEKISEHTGAQDSCVTSCASAGIAISIAGIITKGNLVALEKLPDSEGLANEVILQKGHAINFGVPITTMIRLGGGKPVEAGTANRTLPDEVEGLITEKTSCLLFCKSHHAVQKGMLSLEEMIQIAHKNHLPIVVDAAAEEDLRKYIAAGADLVVYSGAKALEATTSGFITGRKDLIAYCKKQYSGIGRAMKVGKEQIVGLLAALDQYEHIDHQAVAMKNRKLVESLNERLNKIPYCHATLMKDEAGREIYRSRVTFDPECGKTAMQISELLKQGNPSIYCRPNLLNTGVMMFDPRPLNKGDDDLIVEKLERILQK